MWELLAGGGKTMNYKIEKNTVQETLIIPLYARKMCAEVYPSLYRDETALRLVNAVDYDFSALQKKSHRLMQRFGFLEVAMRQNDLAFEVREYRYIKEYRLEQAAVELVRSRKPITEIAQHAGYDNASKFSESFKKRYGKTPSRYRADKTNAVKRSIETKTE